MVLIGQRPGGNIEAKLNEWSTHLYDLLNHLFDEHGFNSQLYHENEKTEPKILYLIKDHLEHRFEENNT